MDKLYREFAQELLSDDDIARDYALHLYYDVLDEAYAALCKDGLASESDARGRTKFNQLCLQFFGSALRSYATDESTPRQFAKQIARAAIGKVLSVPTDALIWGTLPDSQDSQINHAALVKAARDKIANQLVDDVFDQFISDLNEFKQSVLRNDRGPVRPDSIADARPRPTKSADRSADVSTLVHEAPTVEPGAANDDDTGATIGCLVALPFGLVVAFINLIAGIITFVLLWFTAAAIVNWFRSIDWWDVLGEALIWLFFIVVLAGILSLF